MNKLFTKIVGAALGLTMAIGVGVAVASNSKEATPVHAAGKDDWVQVTALSGLNTTDTYVIANDADKGYFMNGTVSSGHFQSTAFGASAPASASAAGAFKLEAIDASKNIYKIKLVSTSKYVYATKAGSGGGSVTGSSDSSGWKFLLSGTSFNAIYQKAYSGKYAAMRCYSNTSWRTYSNNSATSISTTSGTVFRLYKYQSATLSSISVKTAPTKTSYAQGEYFDPTGLVITRTYSDSSTSDYTYAGHTSDFTFSPTTSTALTTSHTSVTITYGGKTCNQAITVSAPKTPSSLSSTGQTTSFEAGETFTYGGTLTVTYTDSTGKTVSPGSFKIGSAGINPTSAGTVITPGTTILNRDDHHGKTVYVLYTENATTVYTSYTISVAAVSKVTFTGGTDTGTAGGQGQSDSLTKSGVTMACDSCYTTSGAYRFYSGSTLTISSTVGNIAQIEFNMNGSYNSNLLSTSTGTYNSSDSTKGIWTGDAASIDFDLSLQARVNSIVITLASNDPTVELDATSATSVSMFKGDSNTSVKVLVKNIDSLTWNFTFDEDENEGLTTSSYISVSASALVSNVSTLTITTKAVGSTTMHISVSGTACEDTVPVTVAAKPAAGTMVAKLNSVVVSSAVEVQTGTYKQFTFAAEDTDGNAYNITADDVTGAKQSGTANVTISGTRVTGTSAGSAVVRYSLKVLSSVYVDITLNVVDDYKTTVKTITVINNAVVDQGDTLEVSDHISVKKANTYWGSEMDIADNELLFSYTNSRAAGVVASSFVFDVTDDTLDAGDTETRTIYVFATFDESYAGTSFTAVITVEDRPVTGLYVNGSEATDEQEFNINVTRYQTYQLDVSVKPSNATESHQIDYAVFMADEGSGVTVNSSGLISVSGVLGQHATISAASHANSDHVVYFNVTVVRETVTITYDAPASWTKVTDDSTLAAGDVIIVTSESKGKVMGEFTGSNKYAGEGTATFDSSTASSVTGAIEYTLETGSSSGTWKLKNGTNYLYGTSAKTTLCLSETATDFTISISSGDATINSGGDCRILHNVNSTRFSNYTSATSTTMLLPQIYKKSGGEATVTATSGLLDVLDAAMTYDDGTYTLNLCDASGSTFNSSAWTSLGNNFTSSIKSSNQLAYARSSETGNEVEQFLACYDYVVGKYGESYDFLGRIASGKIAASSRIAPLSIINGNGNTVAIIVIISMISVTAIGGYFFLRKRKEEI